MHFLLSTPASHMLWSEILRTQSFTHCTTVPRQNHQKPLLEIRRLLVKGSGGFPTHQVQRGIMVRDLGEGMDFSLISNFHRWRTEMDRHTVKMRICIAQL